MSEGEKTLTVSLSLELHRELKMASVVTDRPMKAIVLRAIAKELASIKSELRGQKNGSGS